jgi:hypothetical protein
MADIPEAEAIALSAPSSAASFSIESRRRWIVRARVEVSVRLPGERAVNRLLLLVRRLKREGGRLIDGEVVRAGGRISPLARMHGNRVDRGFL